MAVVAEVDHLDCPGEAPHPPWGPAGCRSCRRLPPRTATPCTAAGEARPRRTAGPPGSPTGRCNRRPRRGSPARPPGRPAAAAAQPRASSASPSARRRRAAAAARSTRAHPVTQPLGHPHASHPACSRTTAGTSTGRTASPTPFSSVRLVKPQRSMKPKLRRTSAPHRLGVDDPCLLGVVHGPDARDWRSPLPQPVVDRHVPFAADLRPTRLAS